MFAFQDAVRQFQVMRLLALLQEDAVFLFTVQTVNVIALPESEKSRLVDVEWQQESFHSNEKFMAEIKIFCNNRIGIFADISKIFTEREIDIASMSSKTSKQGTATINMSFEVGGVDALQQLINRLMAVNSVIDIERSNG